MGYHELWIVLLIGLSAGILSGLVGIGGGIIMVPALVIFMHYSQHQAQGTSLAVLTLPVVILAAITYYSECRKMGTPIDLRVVVLLAVAFLAGAYGGGQLAVRMDKELLRKIFAIVLLYTAVRLLNWDQWIITRIKSI
jgi:uncharacterized membrane protein YfcA